MTSEVRVECAYSVGGVERCGSTLAFDYSGGDRVADRQMLDRLRTARAVTVRYRPGGPAISCLSFGLHRSIWASLLAAIVFPALTAAPMTPWVRGTTADSVLLRNLIVE